jgi:hypothetical protein
MPEDAPDPSTKDEEIERLKAELAKAKAEASGSQSGTRSTSTRSRRKRAQAPAEAEAAIEQELGDLNEKLSDKAGGLTQSAEQLSAQGTPREGHASTANAIEFEAFNGRFGDDNEQYANHTHSARSLGSASTAASTTASVAVGKQRKTVAFRSDGPRGSLTNVVAFEPDDPPGFDSWSPPAAEKEPSKKKEPSPSPAPGYLRDKGKKRRQSPVGRCERQRQGQVSTRFPQQLHE